MKNKNYKKKKIAFFIGISIVILQIIFLAVFQFVTASQRAALEAKYNFSDQKHVYKNLADQRLTSQEYKQEIQEMTDIITKKDPSVALAVFKQQMATNPKILAGCHELLHEIGRIAYKKYNNLSEAMQYRDEVCVGGYIHGVIEGYFSSSKPNFQKMFNTCKAYQQNTFTRWECFHGMGHGLMLYSANNVPLSLVACDSVSNDLDQQACYTGVYMENFNADTVYHPSKYLNLHDPFSLCAKDTKHPEECYLNAPFAFLNYYNNDYRGALEWCDLAPVAYRNICYEGVGAQVTRREFNNPKAIEAICMSGGVPKVNSCISGAADWYLDYYTKKGEALAKCDMFVSQANRNTCLLTIAGTNLLFAE